MKRVVLTLITVTALSCAGMLYARVTRPLLEVTSLPSRLPDEIEPPSPSPEFGSVAEQFLPRQPWAREAPYRHRDDDTYVYCDRYQLGSERESLSVRPFAMVLLGEVAKGEETEPITMVADSAQLDFARSLSDSEFSVGRVKSGQLLGRVRIEGPDDLLIIGRNFYISESSRRIWSDEIVLVRYGAHLGRGRGVEIRLTSDQDADGVFSAEAIRTVRLREDVQLELLAEGDERTAATAPEDLIHVTSQGHLEFDLETSIATLERNIRVRQPTSPGMEDTLKADVLSIQFTDQVNDEGKSELKPTQMTAQGDIELQSLENELLVTQVTDLTYLLDEGIVELANTLAFTDGTEPTVRILQTSHDVSCRRLILVHNEDREIVTAVCRGGGWIKQRDDSDGERKVTMFARWSEELRMEPDPDSNLQTLRLVGDAVVREPGRDSQLSAGTIRLWFERLKADRRVRPRSSRPKARATRQAFEVSADDIRPVRLEAETNVRIATPRMSGPTNKLTIDFDPENGSGMSDPLVQQTAMRAGSPQDEQNKKGKLFDEAFGVAADSIYARVIGTTFDGDARLPEVKLQGRVHVRSMDSPANPSTVIRGDLLHVLEDETGQQTVKLLGKPGHVFQRDRLITGTSIYLDRTGNEAEVAGAGSLRFVVDKDLEGRPLETPEPLEIDWVDRMHFDGRTARLTGKVTASLGNDETRRQELICREMKVNFTEHISFTDSLTEGNDAELGRLLRNIECLGGVSVNSFQFSQGRTIEERHGYFRSLNINQKTGATEAAGPGWITSWTQDRPRLSRAVSARANKSIEARPAGWNFTRVDYMGTLKGNFRERLTTFTHNVEITYGPVERLAQAIDPDAGVDGELPEGAIRIRCNELEVTERGSTPEQRTLELLGAGNAILEGRTIHAEADEIQYDEHKELFTLLGRGNRMARIWQREHPRSRWGNELSAQRWEYSERRQKLTAHGVTNVSSGR